MNSLFLFGVLIFICETAVTADSSLIGRRFARQLSLDDLIHTALQIVKPIFDTSQPLIDGGATKKVMDSEKISSGSLRESNILGVQRYTSLSQVPICQGNSQICRFISCTARNFKHDSNFANLNLAAQLIGDQELRKTIGG